MICTTTTVVVLLLLYVVSTVRPPACFEQEEPGQHRLVIIVKNLMVFVGEHGSVNVKVFPVHTVSIMRGCGPLFLCK